MLKFQRHATLEETPNFQIKSLIYWGNVCIYNREVESQLQGVKRITQ